MSKSADQFLRLVWPVVGPKLGGGSLVPVESVTDKGVSRDLDVLAGIDAWQILADGNHGFMRSIASRVQNECGYRTFTVRSWRVSEVETELQKRISALRCPWQLRLSPHLTIQAYIANNPEKLCAIAVAQTSVVVFAAMIGLERRDARVSKETETWDGEARFIAVQWSAIKAIGAPIWVWPDDDKAKVTCPR